jgi:oligopeptidase B
MRYREDAAVIEHLEAENAYTAASLAHTEELQDALYKEMRLRIKEADSSVPVRRGAFEYYTRTEQGQQYSIYCRQQGNGPEEILLDVNALAAGHEFCKVANVDVSPNGRYLAYAVDFNGSEHFELRIKDLHTGQLLPERIEHTYYSLEWANDNATLFYNTLDSASRPYRIWRHTLGTDSASDVMIHEETDESYFTWVRKSRSGAYLFINVQNNTTSEWRYASADQPAEFVMFATRQPHVEYKLDHHTTIRHSFASQGASAGRFLILTNENAQNFKLMECDVAQTAKEHWRELIPHRAEVLLDNLEVFQDYLVLLEREGGLKQLRVTNPHGQNARRVAFPEPVYTYWLTNWYETDQNPEYETHTLRFTYSSLITPDSVIDYGLADGSWVVRKRQEVPGYDADQFVSERLLATASDGAQVPISIVYKRGSVKDGGTPLFLYAYGSYGATVEPQFSSNRLSLLERGVTCALAHIRGGSEMGRAWYENGKLQHKKNTFTDFIACAEHLIAQGYTSANKLAIMGVSAGGLLMGAVTTLRPDLFKCVVAKVPFVDVINTMNDPSIPLTVIEWEEWGNPAKPDDFAYMLSYSPYDNVQARAYPDLLVTGGLNDPRVAYWEPAKFVAKLRELKTDPNRLLLKTNMGAGHGGASGRFDYLQEIALEYAFMLDTLGAA